VPLSDIAAMEESDESAEQALRALDAELAAGIERQRRMREELAVVLRHRHLVDLPPGFDEFPADLSEADRAVLLVYSRVFGPAALSALRKVQSVPRSPAAVEFDALPTDASEDTRQRLADRYLPEVRQLYQDHPALKDPAAQAPQGEAFASSVIVRTLVELYNPAQLDVLRRLNALLEGHSA
jgi:hypothetical protein